jgi:hypothetical protein
MQVSATDTTAYFSFRQAGISERPLGAYSHISVETPIEARYSIKEGFGHV